MNKDELAEYIRKANEEPTEITAEDLSPPVCYWCGDELGPSVEVVLWDVPIHEHEHRVVRHRYCSEGCKKNHETAVKKQRDHETHGEAERIEKSEGYE